VSKTLNVNEEDYDTRWSEEPGKQVEVGGSLGDIKVRENHIDTVERVST